METCNGIFRLPEPESHTVSSRCKNIQIDRQEGFWGEKVCVSGRARRTGVFLPEVTVKNIWFNLMQETL